MEKIFNVKLCTYNEYDAKHEVHYDFTEIQGYLDNGWKVKKIVTWGENVSVSIPKGSVFREHGVARGFVGAVIVIEKED